MMRISLLYLFGLALMMPFAAQAQERGEISVFGGLSGATDLWDGRVAGMFLSPET
jgi:hypothetical protein